MKKKLQKNKMQYRPPIIRTVGKDLTDRLLRLHRVTSLNGGEAVRDSYYRQIFLFLNHVYTAQERMNEENEYETKTDETRKILGTV